MAEVIPLALRNRAQIGLAFLHCSVRHPIAPLAAVVRRRARLPVLGDSALIRRAAAVAERFVRARYQTVLSSKTVAVGFDGTPLYVDSSDRNLGVSFDLTMIGILEPEVSVAFLQTLRPGMTVIDVGANLGWYTMLAATRVGPSGLVVAVEPEARNFSLLSDTVRLNRLSNVRLVRACLDAERGERMLYISNENAGGHSITHRPPGSDVQRVPSETLDNLVSKLGLGKVDLIKIDAESAEPLIVAGGKSILFGHQSPLAIMEFSPSAWTPYPQLRDAIDRQYSAFQFSSFRRGWTPVRVGSIIGADQVNLYLVPRSMG